MWLPRSRACQSQDMNNKKKGLIATSFNNEALEMNQAPPNNSTGSKVIIMGLDLSLAIILGGQGDFRI